ncbi:TPA: hypothetical protein ACV5RJ_002664 [Enterobacter roggenkampii]
MTSTFIALPNELFLTLPDSLSALDIFLYGVIAKKTDINNTCELDIKNLCRVARASQPTVRRIISRLSDVGLIKLSNFSLSRSSVYTVKTIEEALKGE